VHRRLGRNVLEGGKSYRCWIREWGHQLPSMKTTVDSVLVVVCTVHVIHMYAEDLACRKP